MYILECSELGQTCYNFRQLLVIIKFLLKIIQWTVPLGLIIYGSIDFYKAVINTKDEDGVKHRNTFFKRLAYAAVIFIVPFLVRLLMSLIDMAFGSSAGDTESWLTCWNAVDNENDSLFDGCVDPFAREADPNSSGGDIDPDTMGTCQYEVIVYGRTGQKKTVSVCLSKQDCDNINGDFTENQLCSSSD